LFSPFGFGRQSSKLITTKGMVILKLANISWLLLARMSVSVEVKIKIVSFIAHKVIMVTNTAMILRSIFNCRIDHQILAFSIDYFNKIEKRMLT